MSDVSALMDKLKSTIAYQQFDAPRSAEAQAWPVLEKMAQAKNALSHLESAPPPAPAPAPAPTPTPEARTDGSLFDRLQAEGRTHGATAGDEAPKGARFSRYANAKDAGEAPQALSEIFERIGRKVR